MFAVLGGVTLIAHIYSLNGIKSRTVGDGQHGTARWANRSEIRKTYKHVPFTPEQSGVNRQRKAPPVTPDGQPLPQGIVVGCTGNTTTMVDTGDVHALMIGAAGVGKRHIGCTPCIEYACLRPECRFCQPTPKAISCATTARSPRTMDIIFR